MKPGSHGADVARALKPYRRRLTVEAVLRALIIGAAVGAGAGVILCVLRLAGLPVRRGTLFLCAIGIGIAAACLAYCIKLRVGLADTAARVDALGLSDRVSTMLEFAGKDSPAVLAQRRDALRALDGIVPEEIPLAVPKKVSLTACVLCLSAVVLLCLPIPASRRGEDVPVPETQKAETDTPDETSLPDGGADLPGGGNESGGAQHGDGDGKSQGSGEDGDGKSQDGVGLGKDIRGTSAMKEVVYDPGQHITLPYGDVYAAYYIQYEKQSDSLPGHISDAMRDYLDRLRSRKEE